MYDGTEDSHQLVTNTVLMVTINASNATVPVVAAAVVVQRMHNAHQLRQLHVNNITESVLDGRPPRTPWQRVLLVPVLVGPKFRADHQPGATHASINHHIALRCTGSAALCRTSSRHTGGEV